jgi:predicted NAD/FAD-dependent oxidoreductase
MSETDTTDVLIIGAGIAGLLCATELNKTGRSVRILEKGRGPGGRMATRRMGKARLDHGAQFFTVRSPSFQRYVDEWLEAGVIREWFRHAPHDTNASGYSRYCGVSGISDAPKYLSKDLDLRCTETVTSLAYDGSLWTVATAAGASFRARYLVLTAPLPQALALLDATGLNYGGAELDRLRAVRYDRGLATLAILDGPSGLPESGFLRCEQGPLTWIADNHAKGISPQEHAITLHANAVFADQHWDSPDSLRGSLMLKAAARHLKANVREYNCHRWGFCFSENPYPDLCFSNAELNLLLAGDSFGGPRVEGAALSGLAASSKLLETIAAKDS